MAVGLHLGNVTDEIGTQDFFFAFFSTIAGNLEPAGWGSRFPALMTKLYQGALGSNDCKLAQAELSQIRSELKGLPPSKVIWDYEDRTKVPPWGDNISTDIHDLSDYFVTSTGRDLIGVIEECLQELRSRGGTLRVVSC